MLRNFAFTIVLLVGCSCGQNKIEGYWKGVFYNDYGRSINSRIVNPHFQGNVETLPSIVFYENKIELPFGLKGWNSLSFEDNFQIYKLVGKDLTLFEGDNREVFQLTFFSQDSICISKNGHTIMCYKRKILPQPCNFKKMEFRVESEEFSHCLKVYEDGRFDLTRSGVRQDSISEKLSHFDFKYIKTLISRIDSLGKTRSAISDVPDYYLKVQCGEKMDSINFSGLQNLPYDLRALLYNLEKLTKAKK